MIMMQAFYSLCTLLVIIFPKAHNSSYQACNLFLYFRQREKKKKKKEKTRINHYKLGAVMFIIYMQPVFWPRHQATCQSFGHY